LIIPASSQTQSEDNIVPPPLLIFYCWAQITPSSLPEDPRDSNPPPLLPDHEYFILLAFS